MNPSPVSTRSTSRWKVCALISMLRSLVTSVTGRRSPSGAEGDRQDAVVGVAGGEPRGHVVVAAEAYDPQRAPAGQLHAVVEAADLGELEEDAAELPSLVAQLGVDPRGLELVDLRQHHLGDDDVGVVEGVDHVGLREQDVGVYDDGAHGAPLPDGLICVWSYGRGCTPEERGRCGRHRSIATRRRPLARRRRRLGRGRGIRVLCRTKNRSTVSHPPRVTRRRCPPSTTRRTPSPRSCR